jgi:predicted nuclease of predicted toxin-antitoxin system
MAFVVVHAKVCIFRATTADGLVWVIAYVDDMIVASKKSDLIKNVIEGLAREFRVQDLGSPATFLGFELSRDIFRATTADGLVWVIAYVDDMIVASKKSDLIKNVIEGLAREFRVQDLGSPATFLGFELSRDRERRTLSKPSQVCCKSTRALLYEREPCS